TQDNGKFYLMNMTGKETLITQYLGYKPDTLQLHGQKELVIRLVPASSRLSEVTIVNTGYQKLDKEHATGAYAKPDMQVFQNRSSTMDVVARLDGLVPGVTVISGPTGSGSNQFGTGSNQKSVIRGKSSITLLSEPLYVINGVQVPNLSNINPNDIADITVLKDAAAAAIYGVKAANGVIVITTKSGKKGEKVHINYSGYINFQGKPRPKDGYYLNSSQLIQAEKEIFDPVTYPWSTFASTGTTPNELIMYNQYRGLISAAQANKSLDSLSHIDNRQQVKDLFYRNAFTTNHTVSASAGSDIYTIYSSLSYTDNHSNTPGEVNNAYRININQTITPASWLTIGLATSLNNTLSSTQHPVTVSPSFLPYQLFEDPNGNPLTINYIQGLSDARRADYQARSRINLDYIPLDEANEGYNRNNLLNVNNTANIGVKFWKGLSFQGTYGYQKSAVNAEGYVDHTSYDLRKELLNFTVAPDAQTQPVYYLPTTGGKYTTRDSNSQNWTVRNQLVFNTSLRGGKDKLNIQAGQEAMESSDHEHKHTERIRRCIKDLYPVRLC
ncbi:MAG TPA: TonB-dependent receptor plug domain-containing protein, partial [Pedobacter sp.]